MLAAEIRQGVTRLCRDRPRQRPANARWPARWRRSRTCAPAPAGRRSIVASFADRPSAVALLDAGGPDVRAAAAAGVAARSPWPSDDISRAEPISFPTSDGDTAHGFFYPPRNQPGAARRRRAPAAAAAGPRRADRRHLGRVQPRRAVLDHARLRGVRPELPGQHRVRAALPGSPAGAVGRLRRRRLPGGGAGADRRRPGGSGARGHPGQQRRRLHRAGRAVRGQHLPRRLQPVRDQRSVGAGPGHPQVRIALLRRAGRPLAGARRPVRRSARR